MYRGKSTRNYINEQMISGLIVTSKPKSCTRETELSSKQLCLEKQTKQTGTSVKQHDKGIQNIVYMSKTEVDVRKCGKVQASEMIVYEQIPLKFANENTLYGTSPAIELENLSCLECSEEMEKDNGLFLKTFSELMNALESNSKNVQQNGVKKEDAMNTIIVLSKIKEYADELLKIYMLVDRSKRQLLNKFYSRSKSKSKYSLKRNSALNPAQTQNTTTDAAVQCSASFANSKDIQVLYCAGPSTSKIGDCSLSENSVACVKTMTDELFVKDKDITARSENHDVGLSVSLPRTSLRNSGTQYVTKQLRDSGIVTDRCCEDKISVATQSGEPILIRVIKSNNNEGILKSDKGTCVRDAHVLWMANVDKGLKNMYQDPVREYFDELLHPSVSHVREKDNCTDYDYNYCSSSFVPNEIYRYERYKSSCDHDWTEANIPNLGFSSNQHVSRIPLYGKLRKCTRRAESYRMS